MPMPSLHLSSSARQAVIVAILVILSSFGVGVARLAWTDLSLRALAAEEQGRVDGLKQEISLTEKSIARAKTDEYVKEWARQVAKQSLAGIRAMPAQMLAIGVVQFFSWLAFFSMWSMATPGLTEHVFHAPAPDPHAFDMTVPAQAAGVGKCPRAAPGSPPAPPR